MSTSSLGKFRKIETRQLEEDSNCVGMESDALSICKSWLDAVNRKDLQSVLSLYADDAVLLPTFSPRVLRTADRRRDYFDRLSRQPGLRVHFHERTFSAQAVGNHAIASGIYRFEMDVDEAHLVFEARFTFILDLQAEQPILHHHSSQIPRNLT